MEIIQKEIEKRGSKKEMTSEIIRKNLWTLAVYFKQNYTELLKLKWKEFIKSLEVLNKMIEKKEIKWI
ncbi:MAG: hypothetical protein ACPL1F_00105 [bacterium]